MRTMHEIKQHLSSTSHQWQQHY